MKRLPNQTQLELLGIFYTNSHKAFYMREISQLIGKQPGVFQRALNGLVEAGFLTSKYRGHARFFQANPEHPLYPELRRIVAKTVGVEGALRQLVGELPDIKLALLYGSFAKGRERAGSDIDLLVVGAPRIEEQLVKAITRLERRLQRDITYRLYSEREYREKRARGDPFLEEVLADRTILLKGGPDAV